MSVDRLTAALHSIDPTPGHKGMTVMDQTQSPLPTETDRTRAFRLPVVEDPRPFIRSYIVNAVKALAAKANESFRQYQTSRTVLASLLQSDAYRVVMNRLEGNASKSQWVEALLPVYQELDRLHRLGSYIFPGTVAPAGLNLRLDRCDTTAISLDGLSDRLNQIIAEISNPESACDWVQYIHSYVTTLNDILSEESVEIKCDEMVSGLMHLIGVVVARYRRDFMRLDRFEHARLQETQRLLRTTLQLQSDGRRYTCPVDSARSAWPQTDASIAAVGQIATDTALSAADKFIIVDMLVCPDIYASLVGLLHTVVDVIDHLSREIGSEHIELPVIPDATEKAARESAALLAQGAVPSLFSVDGIQSLTTSSDIMALNIPRYNVWKQVIEGVTGYIAAILEAVSNEADAAEMHKALQAISASGDKTSADYISSLESIFTGTFIAYLKERCTCGQA